MSTELIEFEATDGLILNGFLDRCEEKTNKVLIQIHGMTSNCFKKRDRIIANKIKGLEIDIISFNNRGAEIVRNLKYKDGTSKMGGTAFEDIEESYYDILGAVDYAISKGYKSIYLQGHSLGATKTVFLYNKMKNNNNEQIKYIKGIILLSLVDVPGLVDKHLNPRAKEYIISKEQKGELMDVIPTDSFMKMMSVKTVLRYMKYNENFNFAQYSKPSFDFKEINNIDVPLFMRWGNTNEMIEQNAEELVNLIKEKINVNNADINFIEGADHSYNNKEELLAQQIFSFIKKCES